MNIKHLVIATLTTITLAIGTFAQAADSAIGRKGLSGADGKKIESNTPDAPSELFAASFICPNVGYLLARVDATIRVQKEDAELKHSQLMFSIQKDSTTWNWNNWTRIKEIGKDGHDPTETFKSGVYLEPVTLTHFTDCVANQTVTYYFLGAREVNAKPLSDVFYVSITAHFSQDKLLQ